MRFFARHAALLKPLKWIAKGAFNSVAQAVLRIALMPDDIALGKFFRSNGDIAHEIDRRESARSGIVWATKNYIISAKVRSVFRKYQIPVMSSRIEPIIEAASPGQYMLFCPPNNDQRKPS